MVDKFLAEKVTVSTNGRQERVHRDEALMMAAYSKAMKGDTRSMKFFMDEIASRTSHKPQNNVVGSSL
jgi:predicted HAD superfamily phosphohydrolase YqeG